LGAGVYAKKNSEGDTGARASQSRVGDRLACTIDRVLAKPYGFTDEELDSVINYDIKERLGQDSADDED
jgi:hypothetical protein